MVTTLSPCWYCSGLVRQFGIGRVVVGEARTFHGGHDWLAEHGVEITIARRRGVRRAHDRLHRRAPGAVERGHRGGSVEMAMIPTVDLDAWRDGDPAVGAAPSTRRCSTPGFLLVTGHGVPDELRTDLRAAARRFFALPASVKERYAARIGGRGWLPPGVEANGLRRGHRDPAGPQGVVRRRPRHPDRRRRRRRRLVPAQRVAGRDRRAGVRRHALRRRDDDASRTICSSSAPPRWGRTRTR